MQPRLGGIVKGALTLVPGMSALANSNSGGTLSPRYCYSVWLRHLRQVARLPTFRTPQSIAELGPGDSLGIGLAAMLSGADRYFALDRKPFAAAKGNIDVLDELVTLFAARTPVPDDGEFPGVDPKLDSYAFPHAILRDEFLERCLNPARLDQIRACLRGDAQRSQVGIQYFAPWDDGAQIRPDSVDWIFSQAVLEHVDDICGTYANLTKWLRPGGVMSHTIDYSSHGLTRDWYGHWTVAPRLWKLIRGRRAYLINRLPHSAHIAAMQEHGLQILHDGRVQARALSRRALAADLYPFTDDDLAVSSAFVIAEKQVSRS
jgi:hypothetical protein